MKRPHTLKRWFFSICHQPVMFERIRPCRSWVVIIFHLLASPHMTLRSKDHVALRICEWIQMITKDASLQIIAPHQKSPPLKFGGHGPRSKGHMNLWLVTPYRKPLPCYVSLSHALYKRMFSIFHLTSCHYVIKLPLDSASGEIPYHKPTPCNVWWPWVSRMSRYIAFH